MRVRNGGNSVYTVDIPRTSDDVVRRSLAPGAETTVANVDPWYLNQSEELRRLAAQGLAVAFLPDTDDLVTLGGGGGASDLDDHDDVTLTAEAEGDLLVRAAGDWENFAPGASGTALRSQGPGNALAWGVLLEDTSNAGGGEGLALAPAGGVASFKSLVAGTGITLTPSADEVQIAAAGGGGGGPTITVTSDATYAVQNDDEYVLSTRSATGTGDINLPAIADHETKVLRIGDRARNANANPITINPDGTETINGQSSYVLTQDGDAVTLVGAGSEWTIV